ncbi:GNAT family N-acetyltransferase [Spirosoma sp.]|uniref:GNAT family N-acetyltransferase n=1 Tax=Spirosoma sp. TaxID=1899569 RepID=UPI003B3B68F9
MFENPITFLRITGEHPYLSSIQVWYEGSFPIEERRNFSELLQLLSYPDMCLCALVVADRLVGFMIYWQWNDLAFIEHFAIDPAQRGKQVGQQALRYLLRNPFRYVVLEVELPNDEISRRRIQFYERQGFALLPFDYVQPPYQPEKPAVPMRLMSVPPLADEADFNKLSTILKERVYERFYIKNRPTI